MIRAEHQMFAMWKDFQEHLTRQLPRREERSRPVRRIHGRGEHLYPLHFTRLSALMHRISHTPDQAAD